MGFAGVLPSSSRHVQAPGIEHRVSVMKSLGRGTYVLTVAFRRVQGRKYAGFKLGIVGSESPNLKLQKSCALTTFQFWTLTLLSHLLFKPRKP